MKLPAYVRKFNWPLNKVYKGFVLFNKVCLREDIYKDLQNKSPKPENVGILIHEETHLRRFKSQGIVLHGIKFWLFPSVRYREEIEADKARFKYLKRHKVKFDFKKRARRLSGFWYLYCVSYDKALADLQKVWGDTV